MHAFLLFVLLSQASADPAETAVQRLRSKVAVVPVVAGLEALAGKYTSEPEEKTSAWGGGSLSGEDLHLFPDGTYVYCEWADVEPLTVYDKGVWRVSGATLTLNSDPDVKWDPQAERKYLLLRRESREGEVMLIGFEDALPYFESEAGDDPEFMLLIVGLLRIQTYVEDKAAVEKAELMKRAWRPEYFVPEK